MNGQMVEISVLGSVAVHRDGVELELGPQLRRVLAALISRHGSVVSIDKLVDSVWMGEPPDGAEGSIKTYVTRLRRALDPDRDGLITYHDPGYVLALKGHSLDSDLFDSELDEATRLLRTADEESAIRLLVTALGRWHGDAYAAFSAEDWARPEAVRLEERRLEGAELLIEARLGVGDTERALAEARSLVESSPLRERPRELLMRALFAAGRQANALREFREFRDLLVEEAGLDPSSHLVELDNRIARADQSLVGRVRTLRGYELGERIGEGAFAVVHRAVQPGIERDVAVKIIRSELADRPEFVRRFEHEAQVVASVEHPHVVPLYDFWREPGAAYLVMRLLRGGSVEDVIRTRGPYSQRAAATVLTDIGGALGAAHRKGVVHRDVRPANLLLDEQGVAYLADFGIALPTATAGDVAVASPAYASPEMLRGEATGVAADVLSLGVTAFEMLTGRLPFADSDSRAELIRHQLNDPLPSAHATRTDLPERIDQILARATAKVPDDRHASVAALVEELVEVLDPGQARVGTVDERLVRRAPGMDVENPYIGLQAFDERDADRFHGRGALVTELVQALERERFVVVVGPSGSGKSSVVRAGLVPALRRGAIPGSDEWFVTTMLPGSNPIDALETALLRVAVNPPASLREQLGEHGGLLRAVRRVLPDDNTRILVVIDQLEELFTMSDTAEQDRFLSELAAALTAPSSPLLVVATLRADHYDVPLRHPAFAELATAGTVTVRPMTPSELERVIVKPAAAVGVEVESALVAELVAGVSQRPAALPLMQFALTEAFERRVSGLMLASVHHELGGLTGAVAARADRIVDAGGPDDESETRRIFGRLVTLGEGTEDTRRRVKRSEFGSAERTAWLLDAFTSARLLTVDRDEATREPTAEVAHEALLRDWPRLRAWLSEDRNDLRTLRGIGAATNAWINTGRDHGELARSGRLASVNELAHRRPEMFNEQETEWAAASSAAAEAEAEALTSAAARDHKQNRQLRQLLAVAAVLVVFALIATLVAVNSRNSAVDSERAAVAAGEEADTARNEALANEQQALTAEQQALAAEENANIERISTLAAAKLTEAPDLAILLALEANRRRDDIATQTALHRSIASQPSIISMFPSPLGEATLTAFSRNSAVAVAWSQSTDEGRIQVFDPRTGVGLGPIYTAEVGVEEATISGDGSVVAVAFSDGTIRFINADGEEIARSTTIGGVFFGMSLDRSGSRLLVSTQEFTKVIDVGSGTVLSTYLAEADSEISHEDAFGGALSNDGSYFVVAFAGEVPATAQGEVYRQTGDPVRSGYDVVDAEAGERLERVDGDQVTALALSAQDRLVVGYKHGTVEVRDVVSGAPSVYLPGPDEPVVAVGSLLDGTIISANAEGTVIFRSGDGSTKFKPLSMGGEIYRLAASISGVVVVSMRGAGVAVVDHAASVAVDSRISTTQLVSLMPASPYQALLSVDGNSAEVRRLSNNEVVVEYLIDELWPNGYGGDGFVSSDGEWVLHWQQSGPIVMVSDMREHRQYAVNYVAAYADAVGGPFPDTNFTAARPAPGGEKVIFTTRSLLGGPAVAFWIDSETSEVISGPLEFDGGGRPMVMDDGTVVIGVEDTTVKILPPALDTPAVVVPGTEGFEVLDKDENSRLVLIGASNGRVGLVDVEEATVRFLQDATGSLTAGAFSPDGRQVVVFSVADGAQVLDVATGQRIGVPMSFDAVVPLDLAISWSEDGKGVWLGTESGPVRFAADPAAWREIACGIVNRELTADEWRTLVSDTEPQVSSCA